MSMYALYSPMAGNCATIGADRHRRRVAGLNRSEHGHAAGLRTTLLVCLAASASMIQVNLLLPLSGKTPESFSVLDLMRLPLGILSGMGFIGAGAIVKKGSFVHGLTTAATLWFATVLGLCFGGGKLALGVALLLIGLLVLEGLKWMEKRRRQDRRATLAVVLQEVGPADEQLAVYLKQAGYEAGRWAVSYNQPDATRALQIEVRWRAYPEDVKPPALLNALVQEPGVLKVDWSFSD
jgi:putative Mg2+ transporter-C (MgtC) family protein